MATSGTTTFAAFQAAIIRGALRKCGRLGAGEDIDPAELADLSETLNELVLDLQNDEIYLWQLRRDSVTLVAATNSYSLTADVLDVKPRETFLRQTSNTQDTLLGELTREQYMALPDKDATTTVQGVPVAYYVDKVRSATTGAHEYMGLLSLYVWPTPDTATAAAYTLRLTAVRKLEDLGASADDPDWPTRWIRPLSLILAADISNDYSLALEERRHLMQLAESRRRVASRADTERGGFRIAPRMR